MLTEVWLLCLTTNKPVFPNLSVLGVYTTKENAKEALAALPKENIYLLYKAPVDTFLGYFKKTGQLKDGMGQLYHEHFEPTGEGS